MTDRPSPDPRPDSRLVPRFAIVRAATAQDAGVHGIMTTQPLTEIEQAGGAAVVEAGAMHGATTRVLFEIPGMSLTHAWFKSGFPLPRHTHDVDCLYYITAGSLKIGTEELGGGDCFFVGADVPYTYVPGPDGVEVLEFRASNAFDIRLLANNSAFWDKAKERVETNRDAWETETPPSMRGHVQRTTTSD